MIVDFGSYYVGGEIIETSGRQTKDVRITDAFKLTIDENGTYSVSQGYVQYFVPVSRNDQPPIVLVHGGGLCGSVWEQTPDGRRGWLHRLLEHGFEVHVLDSVERGRAGWSPHVGDDVPITRTLQEAWQLFRFGSSENYKARKPFANQKFPVDCMIDFGRFFVPRWTCNTSAQIHALASILRRLGKCSIMFHSHGGETAFGASEIAAENVHALIALEPSGFPKTGKTPSQIPLIVVAGDYLDINPFWQNFHKRWLELVHASREDGAFARFVNLDELGAGYSHMFMQDHQSDEALDFILENSGGFVPRCRL